MQLAFRSARWPRLLLAIYLACLGLVCSFILFEVLDVDGSDFMPLNTVAVKLSESHQDDLKRVVLAALAVSLGICAPLTAQVIAFSARMERAAAPALPPFAPTSATRALLPRAALADAPSA